MLVATAYCALNRMAERQPPPVSNPLNATQTAILQPAGTEDNPNKDPVFLVMFTGQIQSAEASLLAHFPPLLNSYQYVLL